MNATDLRNDLLDVYQSLRAGKMERSEAKALATIAGSVLSSAKLQLAYANARKEKPKIPFIEG